MRAENWRVAITAGIRTCRTLVPLPPDLKLRLSTIAPDHLTPTVKLASFETRSTAIPAGCGPGGVKTIDIPRTSAVPYFVQFDGTAYAHRPIGRADGDVNARSFDPELCIR